MGRGLSKMDGIKLDLITRQGEWKCNAGLRPKDFGRGRSNEDEKLDDRPELLPNPDKILLAEEPKPEEEPW